MLSLASLLYGKRSLCNAFSLPLLRYQTQYACMHVCLYACMHVGLYACMHVCMCHGRWLAAHSVQNVFSVRFLFNAFSLPLYNTQYACMHVPRTLTGRVVRHVFSIEDVLYRMCSLCHCMHVPRTQLGARRHTRNDTAMPAYQFVGVDTTSTPRCFWRRLSSASFWFRV